MSTFSTSSSDEHLFDIISMEKPIESIFSQYTAQFIAQHTEKCPHPTPLRIPRPLLSQLPSQKGPQTRVYLPWVAHAELRVYLVTAALKNFSNQWIPRFSLRMFPLPAAATYYTIAPHERVLAKPPIPINDNSGNYNYTSEEYLDALIRQESQLTHIPTYGSHLIPPGPIDYQTQNPAEIMLPPVVEQKFAIGDILTFGHNIGDDHIDHKIPMSQVVYGMARGKGIFDPDHMRRFNLHVPSHFVDYKDEPTPSWVDFDSVRRGQLCYGRNITPLLLNLQVALLRGFIDRRLSDILSLTGESLGYFKTFARYTITGMHIVTWTSSDLSSPYSAGRNSLRGVRLLHSHARIRGLPYYQAEARKEALLRYRIEVDLQNQAKIIQNLQELTDIEKIEIYEEIEKECLNGVGIPLSQADMCVVQMAFACIGPYICERDYGLVLTTQEAHDICHMWRYIGHLLGIRDEFNICNDFVTMTCALEELVAIFNVYESTPRVQAYNIDNLLTLSKYITNTYENTTKLSKNQENQSVYSFSTIQRLHTNLNSFIAQHISNITNTYSPTLYLPIILTPTASTTYYQANCVAYGTASYLPISNATYKGKLLLEQAESSQALNYHYLPHSHVSYLAERENNHLTKINSNNHVIISCSHRLRGRLSEDIQNTEKCDEYSQQSKKITGNQSAWCRECHVDFYQTVMHVIELGRNWYRVLQLYYTSYQLPFEQNQLNLDTHPILPYRFSAVELRLIDLIGEAGLFHPFYSILAINLLNFLTKEEKIKLFHQHLHVITGDNSIPQFSKNFSHNNLLINGTIFQLGVFFGLKYSSPLNNHQTSFFSLPVLMNSNATNTNEGIISIENKAAHNNDHNTLMMMQNLPNKCPLMFADNSNFDTIVDTSSPSYFFNDNAAPTFSQIIQPFIGYIEAALVSSQHDYPFVTFFSPNNDASKTVDNNDDSPNNNTSTLLQKIPISTLPTHITCRLHHYMVASYDPKSAKEYKYTPGDHASFETGIRDSYHTEILKVISEIPHNTTNRIENDQILASKVSLLSTLTVPMPSPLPKYLDQTNDVFMNQSILKPPSFTLFSCETAPNGLFSTGFSRLYNSVNDLDYASKEAGDMFHASLQRHLRSKHRMVSAWYLYSLQLKYYDFYSSQNIFRLSLMSRITPLLSYWGEFIQQYKFTKHAHKRHFFTKKHKDPQNTTKNNIHDVDMFLTGTDHFVNMTSRSCSYRILYFCYSIMKNAFNWFLPISSAFASRDCTTEANLRSLDDYIAAKRNGSPYNSITGQVVSLLNVLLKPIIIKCLSIISHTQKFQRVSNIPERDGNISMHHKILKIEENNVQKTNKNGVFGRIFNHLWHTIWSHEYQYCNKYSIKQQEANLTKNSGKTDNTPNSSTALAQAFFGTLYSENDVSNPGTMMLSQLHTLPMTMSTEFDRFVQYYYEKYNPNNLSKKQVLSHLLIENEILHNSPYYYEPIGDLSIRINNHNHKVIPGTIKDDKFDKKSNQLISRSPRPQTMQDITSQVYRTIMEPSSNTDLILSLVQQQHSQLPSDHLPTTIKNDSIPLLSTSNGCQSLAMIKKLYENDHFTTAIQELLGHGPHGAGHHLSSQYITHILIHYTTHPFITCQQLVDTPCKRCKWINEIKTITCFKGQSFTAHPTKEICERIGAAKFGFEIIHPAHVISTQNLPNFETFTQKMHPFQYISYLQQIYRNYTPADVITGAIISNNIAKPVLYGSSQCNNKAHIVTALHHQFLSFLQLHQITDKKSFPLYYELIEAIITHDFSMIRPELYQNFYRYDHSASYLSTYPYSSPIEKALFKYFEDYAPPGSTTLSILALKRGTMSIDSVTSVESGPFAHEYTMLSTTLPSLIDMTGENSHNINDSLDIYYNSEATTKNGKISNFHSQIISFTDSNLFNMGDLSLSAEYTFGNDSTIKVPSQSYNLYSIFLLKSLLQNLSSPFHFANNYSRNISQNLEISLTNRTYSRINTRSILFNAHLNNCYSSNLYHMISTKYWLIPSTVFLFHSIVLNNIIKFQHNNLNRFISPQEILSLLLPQSFELFPHNYGTLYTEDSLITSYYQYDRANCDITDIHASWYRFNTFIQFTVELHNNITTFITKLMGEGILKDNNYEGTQFIKHQISGRLIGIIIFNTQFHYIYMLMRITYPNVPENVIFTTLLPNMIINYYNTLQIFQSNSLLNEYNDDMNNITIALLESRQKLIGSQKREVDTIDQTLIKIMQSELGQPHKITDNHHDCTDKTYQLLNTTNVFAFDIFVNDVLNNQNYNEIDEYNAFIEQVYTLGIYTRPEQLKVTSSCSSYLSYFLKPSVLTIAAATLCLLYTSTTSTGNLWAHNQNDANK